MDQPSNPVGGAWLAERAGVPARRGPRPPGPAHPTSASYRLLPSIDTFAADPTLPTSRAATIAGSDPVDDPSPLLVRAIASNMKEDRESHSSGIHGQLPLS